GVGGPVEGVRALGIALARGRPLLTALPRLGRRRQFGFDSALRDSSSFEGLIGHSVPNSTRRLPWGQIGGRIAIRIGEERSLTQPAREELRAVAQRLRETRVGAEGAQLVLAETGQERQDDRERGTRVAADREADAVTNAPAGVRRD